ncbi:DUF6048 family protein [Maribacter ulvicola]|uniref:Outer membrane protein beta-barrel domain-containing protein n=1 Tax=Maribacter ulvicola TaxID=228959 RepID=A0A1N6VWK3_9FLAO|nr:DUF6048 family protein [Maribacter ulvicola]SIQ82202.1 hypothetical protein SAMN05421797_103281 [Maribacter ulvicola]
MSRFFINLFLLLITFSALSQSKPIDLNPKDTVVHKQSYGVSLGIDLSRIITGALDDNYKGFEIVADYRLTQNLYIAAELGSEEKTKQEDLYNFTTSGNYIKLGVNKNNYANWYGEHNLIYMGARIGFSSFENTLNNYQYFNTNRYWNPDDFANGSDTPENFSGLNATWIEAVFGTKVEIASNLYMGTSIRLGLIVSSNNNDFDRFPNLWIPGFNKVTWDSNFGVGYNFSISYFLPLYKKKNQAKKNTENSAEPEDPLKSKEGL